MEDQAGASGMGLKEASMRLAEKLVNIQTKKFVMLKIGL
jgi:hypothetical protein